MLSRHDRVNFLHNTELELLGARANADFTLYNAVENTETYIPPRWRSPQLIFNLINRQTLMRVESNVLTVHNRETRSHSVAQTFHE